MSAVVDFPVKPEARPYLDAFAHHLNGEPEWLSAHRRRGLTRFVEQGFPNRRSEAWRYIDLSKKNQCSRRVRWTLLPVQLAPNSPMSRFPRQHIASSSLTGGTPPNFLWWADYLRVSGSAGRR